MVEYAFLLVLIALLVATMALLVTGHAVNNLYSNITNNIGRI
ncbi:MAG TPA: hypothetical protein VEK76_04680 [Candidatus Binatia bacterium]|nr:hypothetical protein [Candidatus Binatia bacterium]